MTFFVCCVKINMNLSYIRKVAYKMKKKIANVIELLLIITSLAMLYVPCMQLKSGEYVAAINTFSSENVEFHFMWVMYTICIIMCVISIISKNQYKDGRIHGIVAILLFIVVNWNAFGIPSEAFLVNNFPVGVFEIVMLSIIVVAIAKRSPMISPTVAEQPQAKATNNTHERSSADELLKYKNLLDQGAITQEEYDKKKSELLN